MMSQAIRGLGGTSTDEEAWERMFRHFNSERNRDDQGYTLGEKVAIKANLVTCSSGTNTSDPGVDPETYNKTRWVDYIDVSPQMIRPLLQQLVYVVGIAQEDITVGDSTTLFPNDRPQ